MHNVFEKMDRLAEAQEQAMNKTTETEKQKKYELTTDTITLLNGRTAYQIRALIDIGNYVKVGDLGGYIEKEANLSHDGDAWVGGNALVFDKARVSGDARVYGDAEVFEHATIAGTTRLTGNAQVYGNATVKGKSYIASNVRLSGNNYVCDATLPYGYSPCVDADTEATCEEEVCDETAPVSATPAPGVSATPIVVTDKQTKASLENTLQQLQAAAELLLSRLHEDPATAKQDDDPFVTEFNKVATLHYQQAEKFGISFTDMRDCDLFLALQRAVLQAFDAVRKGESLSCTLPPLENFLEVEAALAHCLLTLMLVSAVKNWRVSEALIALLQTKPS